MSNVQMGSAVVVGSDGGFDRVIRVQCFWMVWEDLS
jgi:hypothetical protein